jgi:hypothetical protein
VRKEDKSRAKEQSDVAISLCNEIDYNLHILHMISILRDVIPPDSDLLRQKQRWRKR